MSAVMKHEDVEVLDVMPPQSQALAVTDNPYMAMAQMAMQQGKVSEMRELMEMHKEWDAHQAFKAYVDAMAAFKLTPMTIGKNKHVSFKTNTGKTEYDHAELSDVTEVVVPNPARHGFSHSWSMRQGADGITVSCILTHRLGHSESVVMTAPADSSGGKNTIQAIASTKTYLERYTLLAATGLATKGIDDDARGAASEPIPTKDQAWIDSVSALVDYPDYVEMKKKMLADYGGKPDAIPMTVRTAFNRIAELTKPKD